MTGADLCKVNDKLKGDRANWDQAWQDIADYIVFRKTSITGKNMPGTKATNKMFDSTATQAAEDLASWIHSNLTSMGMEWFNLKMGHGFEEDKEAIEWLEKCKKIQFDTLRASNFISVWIEVLNDLTTFATGGFFVEENEVTKAGFNGFNFISLAPGTYSISPGRDGKVAATFREFEISAQEALERWPDKASEAVRKDAEKESSKLHSFVHACFPKSWYGGQHKTRLEYASYYVDVKRKTIMQSGGYADCRFFIIPWKRESGENYGRGPAWVALPDVKTMHKVKELALSEWALGIRPPLAILDNGVVGSVRLTPGGLTIVKKENAITPILTGARYPDNRLKEVDLRNSIVSCFHGDKVKFIPAREETGQMTAYEVSRRYALAQQLLGPTFGNIISHGLDPLIETTFNMMFRAGAFPSPPFSLKGGMERVRIEYESPLARAQRASELASIQNTIQAIAPLEEIQPGILNDTFDLDKTALHIGEINGIPAKLVRSEKDKKTRRDARAKAQMQSQGLDQAGDAAGAIKDVAGAAKDMPPAAMSKIAEMAGKMGV